MSDTEKAQPIYQVGDDVLVLGKVEEILHCDGGHMLSVSVQSDLLSKIKYCIGVKETSVLPALRDGEYTLTVVEVYKLMEAFMMESVCGDSRAFSPFTLPRRACSLMRIEYMLARLKARKEAGND